MSILYRKHHLERWPREAHVPRLRKACPLSQPGQARREDLYINPEALKLARDGEPLPHGTVLTIVVFKAKLDEKGSPLTDKKGRFIKGELDHINVMGKGQGWGAEYPEPIRNGEWEYATFQENGTQVKRNYTPCFNCHKPMANTDFVFSYYNAVEFPREKIR